MRFNPTTTITMKREGKLWKLKRGNDLKRIASGLYQTFQRAYRLIEDQDRIDKIEIKVFRKK